MHLVVVQEQRGRDGRAAAKGEGDAATVAMPVVKRAEIAAKEHVERRTRVGRPIQAERAVRVAPRRERDIGRDRERLLESFVVDVVLRAELSAVRELELRDVDVPPTALVIAVRFVVIAQARVRIPILQPLEIFVSD